APVIASAGTANGGSGHLLGAQFGFDVGGGWVRGTATDAIEAIPGGRELRALGVGATSPPLYAGTLVSAELAQRWFAAGRGLGWLAEAKRLGDDGTSLFLRYTHAPGGSAAFAPARDMLTVYGARRLAAGIALNAGLWAARDTSPAFNRLASSGWSVAPQFALTEWATLEVEARSSRFEATDTLGTFGNSETDGRVGLTARLGRLLGTGSATVGRATRTTAFAGGGSIAPSADHVELSGAVQWASPGGVFGATVDYQQNGPGVGFVPRQYSAGLRVDAVPLPGERAAGRRGARRHRGAGASRRRVGDHGCQRRVPLFPSDGRAGRVGRELVAVRPRGEPREPAAARRTARGDRRYAHGASGGAPRAHRPAGRAGTAGRSARRRRVRPGRRR